MKMWLIISIINVSHYFNNVNHNKNVINGNEPTIVKCNFKNKSVCPLDGNRQQNDYLQMYCLHQC